MRIYVGNLPFSTTEDELRTLFEEHGAVDSVSVVTDRMTGRSRGFGFVEMLDESEARRAIQALAERDLDGRPLKVNEARPRESREGGGRGGRGGRGGGRGGRGGGGGEGRGGGRDRW
jgi:cold-inducible RNA-binding protein